MSSGAVGPTNRRPRHINSERVAPQSDCCRLPAQNKVKNALLHAFLRLSTGDAFGGVSSGVRDIGRTTFTEAHVADLQRLLNKCPRPGIRHVSAALRL